jgi:hypothetical protein
MVGCNNGNQKTGGVASTGTPAATPTAQGSPYNLPPMNQQPFPQASKTTVSTPPNPQFAPAGTQGFGPGPVTPPPNGINNSPAPYNGTSNFTPLPGGPGGPNFPTSTGSNSPPLSNAGMPPFGSPNPGNGPPLPLTGGNFADQRPLGPIP